MATPHGRHCALLCSRRRADAECVEALRIGMRPWVLGVDFRGESREGPLDPLGIGTLLRAAPRQLVADVDPVLETPN